MRAKENKPNPEGLRPAKTAGAEQREVTMSATCSWDESQVLAIIRHAGAMGRSPEEFFNKKWKQALFRGK